jgi:hypothetical protein
MTESLSRRQLLMAAGVSGLGAAYGARGLLVSDSAAAGCLLQREVTEGPFYLDLDLDGATSAAAARAFRSRCVSLS